VPSATRDKDATWRTTATLCRELGWSQRRLLDELEKGLLYRTDPPGWKVRWRPHLWPYLNVKASTLLVPPGGMRGIEPPPSTKHSDLFTWGVSLRIEVLPPGAPADAEVPPSSVDAPAASPAPKRPSVAAVEQCFRDIMAERPDNPPGEDELLAEMTKPRRLGASPGLRARVRELWPRIAPQWKRPLGAPRKKISAKKSAE
jgi:hypothetical protein